MASQWLNKFKNIWLILSLILHLSRRYSNNNNYNVVSNIKYHFNINFMWPLRIWHFTLVLNSTSFWNSENIYEHSNPINIGFVQVYNVRTEQRFVFKVFKTKDYITNLEVFHCIKKYEVKLGKCRQLVTMEIHRNTKPLFWFSVEISTSIALVASWELLNRYPYLLSYIFHN